MAWKVEIDRRAEQELDRLDRQTAARVLRFVTERVLAAESPKSLGKALTGEGYRDYWVYRVEMYRVVVELFDESLTILLISVAHRSRVHKRLPV